MNELCARSLKLCFFRDLSQIQHQTLLFLDRTPQWLFKGFAIPYRGKTIWVELESG